MSKTLFSYSECYSDTVEFGGGGEDAITGSLHNKSEQRRQTCSLGKGRKHVWEVGVSLPTNQAREVSRASAWPASYSILRSLYHVLYFTGTLREVSYYKIIHLEEPRRNARHLCVFF